MDVCEELTHLSSSITVAGPECGQGLSLPDLSLSDGNVLLQLLEFKAHLLEVVEELHIRRDADERFEEQISKLVLEKQELEWEKESLQHQIGSEKNQCAELLSKANKQFQAKIRIIEEEKSRYQLSAEHKEKDIHNLKEELKSLQLTKYNLEKKSSELEQKLALQSRSKDSRLNQLSEVEKRFSALARQCSLVKQAHDKLEQNVEESMNLNKKLTSSNEKQEVIIASLNKEVEKLRNKLVKTKMTFVNPDKRKDKLSIKEQTLNNLHQKLNMECEMNRKFKDENKALQAEKQEVLTSLQLAHQLLSKQTQTLSELELDLETQRKQYQSLEQDHKAMQVKEKTVEEEIKQLTEEYSVSKSNWDKEKAEFLNQINNEQQELMTVKEAYEELHHNHMVLSSKAKEQAQQIHELKVKVKELDLTVIPSKSTKEGGSSGSLSKIELSNSVHALTLAKDSDEPKDKWVSIIRGQAVFNEEYMSETAFESKIYSTINSNNFPSTTILREDMTEHRNNCTMNEVPGVVASSVFKSGTAQMNSSAASSNGFNSANTKVKLITESLFQGDDGAINKANIVAIEEKYGHVQENCEETKEKEAEETENSPKERAQMNDLNEASVTVEDALVLTLNLIAESIDEDLSRGETSGVVEAEQQPQMTEEENQPHVSENTRNNTQVGLSNKSKSALQRTVNEKVEQALPIQEITRHEVLPGDLMESQVCEPINDVQSASPLVESPPLLVCHDLEENAEMVSEESTTAELPQTLKSSSCQSQSDAAQLASVSDQETIIMQTQTVSPPDTPGHTEDTVDKSAKECSPVTELEDATHLVSQKEIFEEKNNLTASVSNNLTNDCEKKGEKEQVDIMDKSTLKCKQSDVDQMNTDIVKSWDEFRSSQKLSKVTTKATMHWPRKSDFKSDSPISQLGGVSEWQKNPLEKEAKMIEFARPFKTTYKPLFERGSTQRRALTYNAKSDMLAHNVLYKTSQMSNTSGYIGNSSNTIFNRSKHNKAPMTITRATGLLTASSVCGTSASSRRPQQTKWRTLGEAHRDTAAGQMDGKLSLSEASSLVCISDSGRQTEISGSPESELGLSCSQDTEEQQSLFRVQISKIEQFLNTERLRLPKRRKTEN